MGFRKGSEGPSFFDLFSQQAANLVSGAALLASILDASAQERVALRDHLHEIEHQGDEINHRIAQLVNQTFVTPFDREDLGAVASCLDDCMDFIDEAGDLIVMYGIENIPAPVHSLVAEQIDIIARCADQTAHNIPALKSPLDLRDFWVELNRLENEGDLTYRRALTATFDSGTDPITIIKLKDLVEVLEEATDAFENLASRIETIAVKES